MAILIATRLVTQTHQRTHIAIDAIISPSTNVRIRHRSSMLAAPTLKSKKNLHPRSIMTLDVHVQETSNLEPVTTEAARTIAERESKAVTLAAESLV